MLKPAALLVVATLAVAAIAVGLAGCTGSTPDPSTDGEVNIVASTNVYGDIAQTIGGPDVHVTSVIDDASQDPHQFEANARVQLALSRADIVIVNGGGYDDFMGTMLAASGNDDAIVVNAVEGASGIPAVDAGSNEHVWYNYEAMIALTNTIATALDDVDAANRHIYIQNMADFTGRLQALSRSADLAMETVNGAGAIITEPVPLYLLDRMGFENLTPPQFSEAIEEDSDVSPALLQSVLNLIGDGSAALVVYNEQTGGPQTDAVLAAATDNRVPTIGVTETLPEGIDYIRWQQSIQLAILAGLDG